VRDRKDKDARGGLERQRTEKQQSIGRRKKGDKERRPRRETEDGRWRKLNPGGGLSRPWERLADGGNFSRESRKVARRIRGRGVKKRTDCEKISFTEIRRGILEEGSQKTGRNEEMRDLKILERAHGGGFKQRGYQERKKRNAGKKGKRPWEEKQFSKKEVRLRGAGSSSCNREIEKDEGQKGTSPNGCEGQRRGRSSGGVRRPFPKGGGKKGPKKKKKKKA